MSLKIHNTIAREKQDFVPLDDQNVRMYVCGPTVYDNIHIGNARPLVIFDVLYRLLKRLYPKVTYARNITDVEDKINDRAKELGVDIRTLTEQTAERFHADAAALGVLGPDVEPRATDHIPEMIALMERLIASGHAYEADGHVLFNVPSMPDYGGLSRHSRDALIAGARVDVAPYKRDPADFVLWKPSEEGVPGWDSPWGRGRPGWHIECSAMSQKHLGEDFDIHGGGQDLIFPHHENEIAQSRCGNPGSHFAKYWMHNGYLMSEGEKMSKSLGNFYTVAELLEEFPGEALRLVLLQTHYRAPLDFTKDGVRQAKVRLDRLYRARALVEKHESKGIIISELDCEFTDALEDDLNTALAISILEKQARKILSSDATEMAQLGVSYLENARQLGLLEADSNRWFKGVAVKLTAGTGEGVADGFSAEVNTGLTEDQIDDLVAKRTEARDAKDFAESDRIRDELAEAGIVLEDKPEGTIWRRV